ncbi:MAG: TIR domain-containing protein, partial [Nitrospiraceae bacterium]|nr:TIR domain-containing protein [Nitrospiraceae bacterium]
MTETMHAPSSPPRIFISYARSDGEDFARLLRRRLTKEYGFAVWQDRTEMQVGEAWWQQIVAALTSEHVEYMVLVMTPAAMSSDMVRKEWRLARQEGVCVLPVIAAPCLDITSLPHWMGALQFTDPDTPEEWTRFIRTLEGPCHEKRVPFMVEDMPEDFVQRSYEFNELVSSLLDCERGDAIAITAALRGAGGYGKTTLAKALCHDERILEAFYDGILWVTLGENPGDLTGRVEDLIEILTGKRSGFEGLDAATSRLAELLANRCILIVIDDVWNRTHLKPFVQGGPLCARLITTRDNSSLPESAARIPVDAMQKDEAVELLKIGLPPADHEALQNLAADLGEWPLLLKLVNSALREHVSMGLDIDRALAYVNEDLSELGLTAFDAEDPRARDQAAAATLGLSLKHLNKDERTRFGELAIFPEDVNIPLCTLEKLWGKTGGLKPVHIRRLSQKLYHRLSLLQTYDAADQTIRLHDVVRKYLIGEEGAKLPSIHEQFLDAYGLESWIDLPESESYLWALLAYHLVEAGRKEEMRQLLFDFDWIQTKLAATDVNSLIADYDYLSDDSDLRLVQGAIRLSAHVLARDKTQLAGQLLGRLQTFQESGIQSMLKQAREWDGDLWLCPRTASLTPPGGPLIRILEGHTSWVSAVAVTPDGKHAISGSLDSTLRVWDLDSGEEMQRLVGHTNGVNAVAVTPDGKHVISGSWDNTLRVWDIKSGEEIQRLVGHNESVEAVVVTLDGKHAISGSLDSTLRVWDLESGEELQTLGHTNWVDAVAVTPDGKHAILGSSDKTLRVWDIESGEEIQRLEGHTAEVSAVTVTPDGKHVISGSWDNTLMVWDIEGGEEMQRLVGHTNWVNAVAVTPDGKHTISASGDKTLKVWDIESGKELRTLEGHTGVVSAVAVTPDGKHTISGSLDMTLRVWDIESGEEIQRLVGHTDSVRAVAVTPDGKHLISGSRDDTLRVWDLDSGEEMQRLVGHTNGVNAVAVTPDGTHAIAGSDDKTLRVWDIESGEEMQRLVGHTREVDAIAVTPDGKH